MKKIAVIGGNLLGCATTLDLALIEEYDRRVFTDSADSFSVTLFERESRLGGHGLKSLHLDNDTIVEVGSYTTLPVPPGTYLSDLISTVNDGLGTIALGTRRIAIPGATSKRRGKVDSAHMSSAWEWGSYGRVVRSFAVWDWQADAYHLIHEGWTLLDLLHRVMKNEIWRSLVLGAFIWSVNQMMAARGRLNRAIMLAQCVVLGAVLLFGPGRVVASWQRNYTFWGSTLPMMWNYGITSAISRGSTLGFVKHLTEMNTKNASTCAVSVGRLMDRTGLEPYLRGSGDDYVRKFKYDRDFTSRFMAPIIACVYQGAKLSEVSSLASHFALIDADYSNSDTAQRLCTVKGGNESLCKALLETAKDTMSVECKLGTAVKMIVHRENGGYLVRYGDGQEESFDGVVLCASPQEDEMVIETPLGSSLRELLGYDRDLEAAEVHKEQEAEYMASENGAGMGDEEAPVDEGSCSHLAIVLGSAKPEFFRMVKESRIPDLVQINHAPGVARFERIREVDEEDTGVYRVICGEKFREDLLGEMFEEGAQIQHFDKVKKSVYGHRPIPLNKAIDECFPFIVLGNRFVYAAATDKLAKHPEMDAISAVNAASLFSSAVKWSEGEKDDGEEEQSSGDVAE